MPTIEKYPAGWRVLHWVMALMVLILIPVGLWMTARADADLSGALTNTLFSAHKALGFSVLLLMILRIIIKVRRKGPAYPDEMPRSLQLAAKSLHHLLYVMLVLTPLLGWAAVTAYPALVVLGGIELPAMPFVPENQDLAGRLFAIHGALAYTLALLVVGHIAAALRHMFRRDGIVRRMI